MMSRDEATRVMQALQRGASFSYTSEGSETCFTYSFDAVRGLFSIREQRVQGGDESSTTRTEQELLDSLQDNYTYAEVRGLMSPPWALSSDAERGA